MNTQTHAILNLALLGRGGGRHHTRSILWGSLGPDLPMVGFWLWETFAAGRSQAEIWSERYFDPDWQLCFDAFNAAPVYGALAAAAGWVLWRASASRAGWGAGGGGVRGERRPGNGDRAGGPPREAGGDGGGGELPVGAPRSAPGTTAPCARAWFYFALAALLHIALDLPLHREDAHRHWLPISTWRFESPVSYWDPAHGGRAVAAIELALLWVGGAVLWRRLPRFWPRAVLVAVAAASTALWAAFL